MNNPNNVITVMVVERHAELRDMIAEAVRAWGMNAVVADSFASASREAGRAGIAAVVSSSGSACDGSWLDVLASLREGESSSARFILATGATHDECVREPGVTVLEKPFSFGELLASIAPSG